MVFIKRDTSATPPKLVPDYRTIEEVGELIKRHGIRRVVLNACRSTHPSGSGETIPRVLRQYGVVELVAMSYKIPSRGVQYFASIFYYTLFTSLSMPFAAWTARRLMQNYSDRLSRFGTKLSIMDCVVPIIYRADNVTQPFDIGKFLGKVSEFISKQLPSLVAGVPAGLVPDSGRESDLLKLEGMLLEGDRAVLLYGKPGIGKTFLLKQLASWWTTTKCITASHTTQLSRYNNFTFEKLFRTLHKNLQCPSRYAGSKALIGFLRETRCLLIIDSLESMRVSESTTLAEQRVAELMKFLKALNGGKSLVVLASRVEYSFLASDTWTLKLSGLKMTTGLQLMREIVETIRRATADERFRPYASQSDFERIVSASGLSEFTEFSKGDRKSLLPTPSEWQAMLPTWETEEDGIYLEEIYNLVDGHPLALKMLTINLLVLGPECTPKEFLKHLLEGGPLILDGDSFARVFSHEDPEGFRTIDEVKSLISDLRTKASDRHNLVLDFLATFWKAFPVRCLNLFRSFQMKEWNMKPSELLSNLSNMFDKLQAAGRGDEFSDTRALIERLKKDKFGSQETRGSLSELEAEVEIWEHMQKLKLLDAHLTPWFETLLPLLRPGLTYMHRYASDHGRSKTEQMLGYVNSHESTLAGVYLDDALLGGVPEGDTASRSDNASFTWEDAARGQDEETKGLVDMMRLITTSLMADGLRMLLDSHLIQIPKSEDYGPRTLKKQYIRTNPILTLVIRGMRWRDDDDHHTKSHHIGLALTYAHRCANWPARFVCKDIDAFKSVKEQANIEFYNLAAAVAIGRKYLMDKGRSLIIEQAMLDLVQKLDWGLAADGNRVHVVNMLWEEWRQDAKNAADKLQRSNKRPPRNNWVDSILPNGLRDMSLSKQSEMLRPIGRIFRAEPNTNASHGAADDLTAEQHKTEMLLFDRRRAFWTLSTLLLRFNDDPHDERTQQLCNDVRSAVKLLKKDTNPLPALRDCIPFMKPMLDFSVKYTELFDGKRHYEGTGRLPIEIMRLLREDLIPAMTPIPNISEDEFWDGAFRTEFPERKAAEKFDSDIADIANEFISKNFDAARRMIDRLREHEIETRLNHPGRRSKLILLGCFASAMQRRFSDALGYLDEYTRLQDQSGVNVMKGLYTKYLRRALVLNARFSEQTIGRDGLELCACCYACKGVRSCAGCLQLVYCSRDCQVKDWKEHKKICHNLYSRAVMPSNN